MREWMAQEAVMKVAMEERRFVVVPGTKDEGRLAQHWKKHASLVGPPLPEGRRSVEFISQETCKAEYPGFEPSGRYGSNGETNPLTKQTLTARDSLLLKLFNTVMREEQDADSSDDDGVKKTPGGAASSS